MVHITKPMLAIIVMVLTIPQTIGRPVLEHIWVQCGSSSCNIMKQYCYQQEQQCYSCNEAVCNTPNFDGGTLAQCYFYCLRMDRLSISTQVPLVANIANNTAECNHEEKKKSTGISMEQIPFSLMIVGTFFAGGVAAAAAAMTLIIWYRNRCATTNNNNRRAFPISPPQDKHSANTDPKEKVKMLISTARHPDIK